MTRRRAHFTVFLDAVGYHESAWKMRADAPADSRAPFELLIEAARTAERGKLDSVFFQDTPGLALFRAQAFPQMFFDAVEFLPAVAASTDRIGLIASASTTYNHPYDLARRFTTVDHISGGRAGWNIVTTRFPGAAANFGRAPHPEHDERYRRAEEFVDVATALWEGWEPDAVVADPRSGVWADIDKIHPAAFHGQYFDVAGALPLPRSPQGRPAFAQAGSSAPGVALGSRVADVIFTAKPDQRTAHAFRSTVRAATVGHGRSPDDVLVLPGLSFVLASTETEALQLRENLEAVVDSDFRWKNLALNAGFDPDRIDPTKPLSEDAIVHAARTSRTDDVLALSRERPDKSFRQVAAYMTGLPGGLQFTGTPEQMAEMVANWVTDEASDGFTLQPELLPGALDLFVDHVVPLLQRRGLHRDDYTADTLRGHFRDDLNAA
jgi:FMN-dependent oxidoreductase (nitrilotriacetate monooxygenase family)